MFKAKMYSRFLFQCSKNVVLAFCFMVLGSVQVHASDAVAVEEVFVEDFYGRNPDWYKDCHASVQFFYTNVYGPVRLVLDAVNKDLALSRAGRPWYAAYKLVLRQCTAEVLAWASQPNVSDSKRFGAIARQEIIDNARARVNRELPKVLPVMLYGVVRRVKASPDGALGMFVCAMFDYLEYEADKALKAEAAVLAHCDDETRIDIFMLLNDLCHKIVNYGRAIAACASSEAEHASIQAIIQERSNLFAAECGEILAIQDHIIDPGSPMSEPSSASISSEDDDASCGAVTVIATPARVRSCVRDPRSPKKADRVKIVDPKAPAVVVHEVVEVPVPAVADVRRHATLSDVLHSAARLGAAYLEGLLESFADMGI
jgi:hypothetical protein